jgi:lysophospholipase L1-like esterase
VALHQTQKELAAGTPEPGHDLLREAAAGAEVVELGPAFQRAAASGTNPYRDDIHPSAEGQRAMANVLTETILELLHRRGEGTGATSRP